MSITQKELIELNKKTEGKIDVLLFDFSGHRVFSYCHLSMHQTLEVISTRAQKYYVRVCFDLTLDESNIEYLSVFDEQVYSQKCLNLFI